MANRRSRARSAGRETRTRVNGGEGPPFGPPFGTVEVQMGRQEQRTYYKQLGNAFYAKRLGEERVRAERLMRELLKKPTPQCEALMARAHRLEDRGELAAAADLYLRVLACEDQADNHALRAHAQAVLAKVNRKEAVAQERVKQAAFEARKGTGGPRAGPAPDKDVGPKMPMSAEAYRAELAAQAMEVRQRRAAAQREAELQGLKIVAVAAAMDALEQHRLHVVGGNDRLSHRNELERERLAKEEDKRRRALLEWDELKAAAEMSARGPLGGRDEYERRREQVQAAHAHRDVARNAFEAPPDQRRLFHDAHGHDPRVDAEEAAWHAVMAGEGRPHAGAGFHRHSRAEREYQQRLPDYPRDFYHQPGGAAAAGLRQRPASAGATTAAAARDRERAAANAANLARLYVPGHPYGNGGGGGPPPQQAAGDGGAAGAVRPAGRGPARRPDRPARGASKAAGVPGQEAEAGAAAGDAAGAAAGAAGGGAAAVAAAGDGTGARGRASAALGCQGGPTHLRGSWRSCVVLVLVRVPCTCAFDVESSLSAWHVT